MKFIAENTCSREIRGEFPTLESAQAFRTEHGRPNWIFELEARGDTHRAWVLAAYPDRPARWFETTVKFYNHHSISR